MDTDGIIPVDCIVFARLLVECELLLLDLLPPSGGGVGEGGDTDLTAALDVDGLDFSVV